MDFTILLKITKFISSQIKFSTHNLQTCAAITKWHREAGQGQGEMPLLKYFKKATVLPDPEGSLSDRMPPTAMSLADKELKCLVIQERNVLDTNLSFARK